MYFHEMYKFNFLSIWNFMSILCKPNYNFFRAIKDLNNILFNNIRAIKFNINIKQHRTIHWMDKTHLHIIILYFIMQANKL